MLDARTRLGRNSSARIGKSCTEKNERKGSYSIDHFTNGEQIKKDSCALSWRGTTSWIWRKGRKQIPIPLAIATLVNARDHGLPLPAAAFVMSPYADLTLAGATMETRREVDPLLSREALQSRVTDYTSGQDAALGLISPVFADLSGLPPLIIQAGTHEVLLDDAVRLAQQAATADVEVTLDITPRVPHVFQAYYPILDEAAAALDRAGQFLSAHLAGAERVTGERKAERKLSS